jgi:uncharacterized RDD family membrane protein YckC
MNSMTKGMRTLCATWLLAAAVGLPAAAVPNAAAQIAPVAQPPDSLPPDADRAVAEQAQAAAFRRGVVRIGQNFTLGAGDGIREGVVIFGDASIEGRVYDNLVVVLGGAQLSSTAVIDGNLVIVGGGAVVASGAQVRGDLVIAGGTYDAPAEFSPGSGHIVIGPGALGGVQPIVPWLTRGLLWGRPIVPELGWVWGVVGVFFLGSLALNLAFDRPVGACAETLVKKPMSTFAVGLLVLLLAAPVCLLLVVSVVGLAVVPFVICALLLAWVVGKVAVARALGMTLRRQMSQESQIQALSSFVIGFAVICVAYMVPALGFAAWAMGGVFGLGAVMLSVIAGYRRENPAPLPRVPSPVMTPSRHQDGIGVREPVPMPPAAAADDYRPLASPAPPAEEGHGVFSPPAGTMTMSDLVSFPRAPFRDRLGAFVLDLILVTFVQAVLDAFLPLLWLLVYHIGFWTWKGTTVGGIICQLRVVRVDGTPLRFVDALVRGLSSIFSLAVLGLGCLWILKDPERQAWHDKIAGTYVVKVPPHWPL